MADIAARAGVSRSSVSFVLNNHQGSNVRIPEATRQRILEIASEMGYRPNQLARAVASGKTRMIGYMVTDPRYEPYWNTIIGALSEAEELGYTLKVLSVTDQTLQQRIRQCVELRLGGLIVRVSNDKSLIFEEAERFGIPVVTVDEGIEQPYGVNVTADDAPGSMATIDHLVQLGHTRIAFISSGFPELNSGIEDIGSVRERLFRQAMQTHGLSVPEGYVTHETMAGFGHYAGRSFGGRTVEVATQALLQHADGPPTAICCWRDETAMLAIRTCRAAGLNVPNDISVVGFSDLSAARFFDPALSTVKSPWDEMGRVAVQQIAQSISQDQVSDHATHLIPTSFIARDSSGPVARR